MDLVTDEEPVLGEPPRGADVAAEPAASGALDSIFAKIDAGELELTGDGGFIPGLIKAALERGLQAELTDHLGYEKGSVEASLFTNSRNGTTPKTLASQVGDIDLDVPRDRGGSFVPRLVPKGSRRLGGLDEVIISLYAGGMTVRDIQHHLATTIGTDLSHETISKITDEILAEVLAWQRRPLETRRFPLVVANQMVTSCRRHRRMSCGRDRSSRHARGRSLSSSATSRSRTSVITLRSVPLGNTAVAVR
jgi:putative transposase